MDPRAYDMAKTNAAPQSAPESATELLNRRLGELCGAITEATNRSYRYGNMLFGARPESAAGSTNGLKPVSICTIDRVSELETAVRELHDALNRFD